MTMLAQEPSVSVIIPVYDGERYLAQAICFLPSALLVRRAILDVIGIFDTRYRHANDRDWFLRAQDAGVPMAIVPKVLVHKRLHSSNLSYE